MKIVDRKTFLEQSAGTVFSKYEPYVFYDLLIKGESISETDNFFYQQLNDSLERVTDEPEEIVIICERAYEEDLEIKMNFNFETLDIVEEVNKDQMFAIWAKEDVQKLINRLQQAINR